MSSFSDKMETTSYSYIRERRIKDPEDYRKEGRQVQAPQFWSVI